MTTSSDEMTALERELAAELKQALSVREDAEVILKLDATIRVGEETVRGATVTVSSGTTAAPLRMFAPSSLLASVLVKSFAAWGAEYLTKLKAHQKA